MSDFPCLPDVRSLYAVKNDKSLLFTKLNELKAKHRVIMTGTPLNNNIRELFNLMNFLDPDNWSDLEALETEYEELTEDLVKQLHDRLRPYFLRRIKSEVLTLPPKVRILVCSSDELLTLPRRTKLLCPYR